MAYTYGSTTNCKVANGQTRSEYQCRLGWEYAVNGSQSESQDITNNQTKVRLRLEARSTSSSYTTKGSNGLSSVIDGSTVKSKASVDMSHTNTWQNFGERTITITHNTDGTYSGSKSGSFTCTAGSSSYSLRSGSASVTLNLATIPRASQPSLVTYPNTTQNVTIGSTITIHMNKKASFTHTVRYAWGNKSGTIATGVADNCSWTIPMDFCNNIPNATSGAGTVYVDTYSGSTFVGTKSVGFTGIVPNNVLPSISSVVLSEGNTNVSGKNWGVYVQNKSQLKVVTTASGSYGSTIKSYKITGIDNNAYTSNNFTSNVLTQSGSKTVTVVVTDTRGRTASKTATYNCVSYSNPQITAIGASRCNSDGTANDEGTNIKYVFKGNISAVSNKNSKIYKIGYKLTSVSSYTYVTITNDSYSINKDGVVLTGVTFDADNSYDIQFYMQDSFATVVQIINLATGFTLMDFRHTGKGMAIGKVSEKDKLEIALPTEFNQDVYINNNKANTNTGWYAKRTDTDTQVWMGVGAGGLNHGLYSNKLNKWLIHGDAEHVFLNGTMWDMSTENTTDTWVPVLSNGKLQHRVINKDINNIVPIVAYSNGSGTSGTVTLSKSSNDYIHIRITYKNDDGQFGSVEKSGISNASGALYGTIIRKNSDNTNIMINSALFNVSDKTITISRNSQANIFFGSANTSDTNKLYIIKVEMWN